jgi:hypothetical protein
MLMPLEFVKAKASDTVRHRPTPTFQSTAPMKQPSAPNTWMFAQVLATGVHAAMLTHADPSEESESKTNMRLRMRKKT